MNIIVGTLAIAAAVTLRIKFRSIKRDADALFLLTLMSGLISILTVRGASFLVELGFGLLAGLVCGIILTFYKVEINRALNKRKAAAEQSRAPQAERNRSLAEQTRSIGRSFGVCAFSEFREEAA